MSLEDDIPRYNPREPDTATLEARYTLSASDHQAISDQRERVLSVIQNPDAGMLAIVGPCALTANPEAHMEEGAAISELETIYDGLVTLHRIPAWKPRTNKKDWHGLETTDPEATYAILANQARAHASVAIETGHYDHIMRYGQLLTAAWTGGRNVHNQQLIEALAIHDPSLPLLVKNGLDGSIESALKHMRVINALREGVAQSAVIFRGGENARTPESWEGKYKNAVEKTNGRVIVDAAHGSEIAHDTENKKSVEGQIEAMEHVIDLAQQGYIPAGIMIEASNIESPTDPVMPLDIALDGVRRLYEIKTGLKYADQDELLVA